MAKLAREALVRVITRELKVSICQHIDTLSKLASTIEVKQYGMSIERRSNEKMEAMLSSPTSLIPDLICWFTGSDWNHVAIQMSNGDFLDLDRPGLQLLIDVVI